MQIPGGGGRRRGGKEGKIGNKRTSVGRKMVGGGEPGVMKWNLSLHLTGDSGDTRNAS